MSDLPKMVPSAEERAVPLATQIARRWLGPATVAHSAPEVMVNALNRAFRDGAIAERERILALLRDDPVFHAARSNVMGLKCWTVDRGPDNLTNVEAAGDIARAVLSAIAAKIGGEG